MATRKPLALGVKSVQEIPDTDTTAIAILSVSGSATVPTLTAGDTSVGVATTAFVGNAVDGMATLSTTGGTTTLTQAQYSAAVLIVSGTLTSNAILVIPNSGIMTVINRTSGAFTVTVKTASGTGTVVTQGAARNLVADGTNVVASSTDFAGLVVPLASGGTGATTTAGARAALGLVATSVSLQWTGGAIVANGAYYFTIYAPYAGTINSLDYVVGTGSFTANVQIAGTSVTGLAAVSVASATQANTAATAANSFTAGQIISVVITAATSSPTNAILNLRMTKA